MFDSASYKARAIDFVTSKQVKPAFHQIFLRAVGCNWLVCLACYLGLQGKDLNSKIVAMWWPIFTFVSLGLDHGVFGLYSGFKSVADGFKLWPTCFTYLWVSGWERPI